MTDYIPFDRLSRNHEEASAKIKQWLFEKFGFHSISLGYHDIYSNSERIWQERDNILLNEIRGGSDFMAVNNDRKFEWEVKTNGEKWNNAAIEAYPLAIHMRNRLEKEKKCVYFYLDPKNEIRKYFWVTPAILPFLHEEILVPAEQRCSDYIREERLQTIKKYLQVRKVRKLAHLTSTGSGDEFIRILYRDVLKLEDLDNFIPDL